MENSQGLSLENPQQRPAQNEKLSEPREIRVVTYGEVPKQFIDASTTAITDVSSFMQFNGDLPEMHISEGPLKLPSGETIPASYESNPGETPKIRLGLPFLTQRPRSSMIAAVAKLLISPIVRVDCPPNILAAAFVSHEAVHHVQAQEGKQLLGSSAKIAPDLHKEEPSEQEANRIAKEVTRKRYKWAVSLPN